MSGACGSAGTGGIRLAKVTLVSRGSGSRIGWIGIWIGIGIGIGE
jgi:hypothetical protein